MNRPIDTLFYDWVTTDEDKYIPTVIEDITDLPTETKIDALLTTYSDYVAGLIESEIINRMVIDSKIERVQEDGMLANEDPELIARAIEEDEDVMAAQETVDANKNALTLLHNSLVKVLSREV